LLEKGLTCSISLTLHLVSVDDLLKEEFEDTKGVIRICTSKKNRQHNGQKEKYKRTNNYLQKHTHKTKDRDRRTPLTTGVNSGAPEGNF